MQVRFAELALADINNIRNQIGQDDPSAASRMAVSIVATADRLSTDLRLGQLGAMPGSFEIVVKRYVLVDEINRTEVVLLRVWHGRQKRPGT